MPELPEVETICRDLNRQLGMKVTAVKVLRESVIKERAYSSDELSGSHLQAVERRGKFIVLNFGDDYYLIVHLGMSGRFFLWPETEELKEKHVHFILHFDDKIQVVFQDTRRFGGIWFTHTPERVLMRLGIEPLVPEFDQIKLQEICKNRQQVIKGILLNQNLIAGIGNIYADEALFVAGIRPDKPAGKLTDKELQKLVEAIKLVLNKSIDARGTTFRDYRDGQSKPGNFQNFLQVYGRKDLECVKCGNLITRIRLLGRGTHFCSQCQK